MRILKKITVPALTAKRKNVLALTLGGLLLFVSLFFLFLTPLRKEVSSKKSEWKNLQAELINGQAKLNTSEKLDKTALESQIEGLRKRLPLKSPASKILEEMAARGKALGIEFVSIMPQPERAASQQSAAGALKHKILPIEIKMKGSYRSVGEYLGALEHLVSGFATINNFQVRKDGKAPPKLDANVTVYTYLLEGESGQE